MKKVGEYIKATLVGGIVLLVPLAVIIFIAAKMLNILRKIIKPLMKEFPAMQVAGIGLATLFSLLLLLLLCFLAGILMHSLRTRHFKQLLEDQFLVHIPGYAYLQAISAEKITKEPSAVWKPATILVDNNEVICFVIDESAHYYSIFLPAAPSPSSGSVCVRKKSIVRFLPLTVSQTIGLLRQFGKGAAAVIEQIEK